MAGSSGKGLFDTLAGLGKKVFGAPKTPAPGTQLVGEPAEVFAMRIYKERLNALTPEKRAEYERMMAHMPLYQLEGDTQTDFSGEIVLPTAEVAYSTDHGKKKGNEDGVFVDPLLDFGVVVDGVSHGGNGRKATEAILLAFRHWTRPEHRGMLQGELRTRKVKDTPENRLKFIGHKAHAAVREALGEQEGGSTVAGTLIEGNKLYSFILGDGMNLVVRDEKVVFCSKPTSRLQRFVDTYAVPPRYVKGKLDEYFASTPIEKIRAEMRYGSTVDLETIKNTIWSDPISVLGYDDVDMVVEEFELEPHDTIISVTDGISEPLGFRVVPTHKDQKTGRWVFNPKYDSMRSFSPFLDPLAEIAHLVGRSAKETRDHILKLFTRGQRGDAGTDHKTILVRRQPLPPVSKDTDPERTEWSISNPPIPGPESPKEPAKLEPIGVDYEDEKTPVDLSRRHLLRPTEPEVASTPPDLPPLPPIPSLPSEPPPLPPPLPPTLVSPPPAEPAPRPPVAGPSSFTPFEPFATPSAPRVEPPPLPPLEPLPQPSPAAPPPLPYDPDFFLPPSPKPRVEPPSLPPLESWPAAPMVPTPRVEPPPVPPPEPAPPVESETQRRVDALKAEMSRLAVLQHDARFVEKNIRQADVLLWSIWDMEKRVAVLEDKKSPAKSEAEWLRVYKNFLRNTLAKIPELKKQGEERYAEKVQAKLWSEAFGAAFFDIYAEHVREISLSYRLAWLEGRFDLLKDQPFEFEDGAGYQPMRIVEVFPPTDPDMPNMVIMHVLGPDGQPVKRLALTAAEWQRKLFKGADVRVQNERVPFEGKELVAEIQAALKHVRLWFRANDFELKLSEGRFTGTDLEPLFADLQRQLTRYPEGYVPSSGERDFTAYALSAQRIEETRKRIESLINPTS